MIRRSYSQQGRSSMPPTDTDDDPSPNDFDRAAFESELARLVSQAQRADIALEGAYDIRSSQREQPDYTVEISRIVSVDSRVQSGDGSSSSSSSD